MRHLPTFLFCLCTCLGLSQPTDKDSIEKALLAHDANDSNKVKLLINLSNTTVWTNTDSALLLASDALHLAKDLGWGRGKAAALRQMGVAYYYGSDYVGAMEKFQEALKANTNTGNKKFELSVYNNVANIYSILKQYDKALGSYEHLLGLSEKVNDHTNIIIALVNRGIIFNELEKYNLAITDYEKALLLADSINNQYFKAAILNNLALVYETQNNLSEAVKYYTKTIALSDSIQSFNTKAAALNSLANIYLLKNEYKTALSSAREALQLGKQVKALDRQRDVYKTMYNAYSAMDRPQEALEAYKKHILLKDSILDEEKSNELTRKEMQYQLDMEKALADAEIKRQSQLKNLSLAGIGILLLAAFAGYLLYKNRRDAMEQKKEAYFKLNVAETELKVLRSQMNPHFIFNSLNSISDYVDKHDIATANDYLIKFARLMRLTLNNSEKKEITLAEELDWIVLYLKLESVRLNEKFSYAINTTTIDPENVLVPPMILQPFVENSIWHGLSQKKGKGEIKITASTEEGLLLCQIDDNGLGRKHIEPSTDNNGSFGMKITQSRIDILNKMEQARASLNLIDKKEGLLVEVRLPLKHLY